MRNLAIAAALASTVLATPAVARDGSGYAGINGGLMLVEDADFDYSDVAGEESEAIELQHDVGFDVDVVAGYDFGMFRLEAEGAYKSAGNRSIYFRPTAVIVPPADSGHSDANGRVRVISAMANALLDFGEEGFGGYAGVGLGQARVRYRTSVEGGVSGFNASDAAWAWQFVAGLRVPVSPNMDAGVKYRFFSTRNLNFDVANAPVPFELDGRFRSHSLLASLVFNFGAPVAPPPPVIEAPVAPPPATQTCPDGSVILATDVCPLPPAPPPPPPPAPERG
jgi:opacity protein-like surface antigen